jgi:hypothetical protein
VPTAAVSGGDQRRALGAVLQTISPEFLALPPRISRMIPPRPSEIERHEEFPSHAGLTFDPLAAAEASANATVSVLLDPARAARLLQYHAEDAQQPGLKEVLDALLNATWKSKTRSGTLVLVQRVVDDVVLTDMMTLAADQKAADEVRAAALYELTELSSWLVQQAAAATDPQQKAHMLFAVAQIRKFEQEPTQTLKPTPRLDSPPGAPIGSTEWNGVRYQCAMP